MIVEGQISKRYVADHGVELVVGESRVTKVLNADVMFGVQRLGDAPGDRIEFDPDVTGICCAIA